MYSSYILRQDWLIKEGKGHHCCSFAMRHRYDRQIKFDGLRERIAKVGSGFDCLDFAREFRDKDGILEKRIIDIGDPYSCEMFMGIQGCKNKKELEKRSLEFDDSIITYL